MGTLITLSVENLEIDWGKNEFFNNHSKLFLPGDIKKVKYYYADSQSDYKYAYCRKLGDLIRRIELLGYSLSNVKRRYEDHLKNIPSYFTGRKLSFNDFKEIISSIDLSQVKMPSGFDDYDLGEFVETNILSLKEFNRVINIKEYEIKELSEIMENMDPYITLRLLLENIGNNEKHLIWRFADLLESGWVSKDELYENLSIKDKYLIVTEGSSDIFIIKKAFEFLMPDISDFFYYVDMENEYPFTGTGNIHRFSQGLASIGIMNKVIVIYDNDAEGNEKCNQGKTIKLPSNMVFMKLPDMDEFKHLVTLGPNGKRVEDINGRAASIECFLDTRFNNNIPMIRWQNYLEKSKTYQGVLIEKDKYTRIFKSIKKNTKGYDFSKLRMLLDAIYKECINIPIS